MSILEIKRLTVRFGGLTAVSNISLRVEPQIIFSLIGPNGAGKTTVFNVITGIYEPTEGRIGFEGRNVARPFTRRTAFVVALVGLMTAIGFILAMNSEPLWETAITANYVYRQPFPWTKAGSAAVRYLAEQPAPCLVAPFLLGVAIGLGGAFAVWRETRRAPDVAACAGIARTFQNTRLFNQMTVLDNVLLGMDSRLRTRFAHAALRLPLFWNEQQQARQQAFEILRFVGLEKEASLHAENLAYGHKRRLEIARALALQPRMLLLDEPAAGMNPAETRELMNLIYRIRERGITIFLIEHDMKVVMGISDRIAVLDHGEKIAEGTPTEVRKNEKVIEAYLGKDE